MIVSDFIAQYLKKKKINDIFMLTGYGAMYLNDSIKKYNIEYYATRNEATAPIMAEAYSRASGKIGVACVTAGPGATNAIPGLAEAYVDSVPIIVFSGQVDLNHTTYKTKSKTIRTFGTAEINIIPIVKPLTKYSKILTNPNHILYELEKCFHVCREGRPGPVWLDIPLNIQNSEINIKKLKKYKPKKEGNNFKKINNYSKRIISLINSSKNPLFIIGNGVKISDTFSEINKISKKFKIPIIFTRGAQDLSSHENENIFEQGGIKGSKYCKKIMKQADIVINFGSRLAPQFVGHDFKAFENARIISIDIVKDELIKKGVKNYIKINENLKKFVPKFCKYANKNINKKFNNWIKVCQILKNKNKFTFPSNNKNKLINLYDFMYFLGKSSPPKSVLITDAGSNYYIGGQVWKFKKKQKEITSLTNAAMGLSIPLSIGASVAMKKIPVFAVTGDGSLELNIQELKTISHYKFEINLFVINNGGYVSMHNWTDNYFKGRRVDSKQLTGEGTLNLKNVAKAFDLPYFLIKQTNSLEKQIKDIIKRKGPKFIEVVTDNKQKIFDAFVDK